MGWLDELIYDHYFECPDGHVTVVEAKASDSVGKEISCGCGKPACFQKFTAHQNIMIRSTFEKNGRLATRTSFANGGAFYMADTKRRTIEAGVSDSVYDKRFKDEVRQLEKRVSFSDPKEV